MEVHSLLDGVAASGAGEAIPFAKMFRDGNLKNVPYQLYGTTIGAMAQTGSGLDDFTIDSYTKNAAANVRVEIDAVGGTIGAAVFTGAGLDDISSDGLFTATEDVEYLVEVDAEGTPDTIQWSKDGGVTWEATGVALTGAAQALDNGVTFTALATTGHTLGEQWVIACTTGADTFKVSLDNGSTWESTGNIMTGASQLLSTGLMGTFAAVIGHTLGDLWNSALSLAFIGTVAIEGAVATDAEVAAGIATFTPIASPTAAAIGSIEHNVTHLRGNVTAYTSGQIFLRTLR